jgi:hypothetical protein
MGFDRHEGKSWRRILLMTANPKGESNTELSLKSDCSSKKVAKNLAQKYSTKF